MDQRLPDLLQNFFPRGAILHGQLKHRFNVRINFSSGIRFTSYFFLLFFLFFPPPMCRPSRSRAFSLFSASSSAVWFSLAVSESFIFESDRVSRCPRIVES